MGHSNEKPVAKIQQRSKATLSQCKQCDDEFLFRDRCPICGGPLVFGKNPYPTGGFFAVEQGEKRYIPRDEHYTQKYYVVYRDPARSHQGHPAESHDIRYHGGMFYAGEW